MNFARGVIDRATEMGRAAAEQATEMGRVVAEQATEMGRAAAEHIAPHHGHHAPRFGFNGHHPPAQRQQPRQQRQPEPPLDRVTKPPPASRRTITTLPTIVVAPEDLVDPNNRECCICFESIPLKSHALRLPCSHIFHPPCILDWLGRSCTCPVCRYELPTDDANYEVGRKKRMAARKPRYARYELERMTAQQLRSLAVNRLRLDPSQLSGLERSQLIAAIIESGKLEIISAPEPVEHCLLILQSMGPRKLRMTMEEAGVFYSKEDVVEKADMISLFLRSGRVALIPEKEENEAEDTDIDEMVGHDSEDPNKSDAAPDLDLSELKQKGEEENEDDAAQWSDASSSQDNDSVTPNLDDASSASVVDMFGELITADNYSEPEASASSIRGGTSFAAATETTPFSTMVQNDPLPSLEEDDAVGEARTAGNAASNTSSAASGASNVYECPDLEVNIDGNGMLPNVTRQTRMLYYASRSVTQLRLLAAERGVDVSDCIEKRDMISRLTDAEAYVPT